MSRSAAAIRAVLVLLALAPLGLAQGSVPAPPEPLLAPGPLLVGFRSMWMRDVGRTYSTPFDGGKTYGAEKSPRPLLVLLWFPADSAGAGAARMPHRQYFAIASDTPRFATYADALGAYARGVFVQQVMEKSEAELDEPGRAELEIVLDAPTLCVSEANPAEGSFPLVVYHSGAGSSFEDNAALCEYLASHGFVVLGSAFPKADGSSLGIDAGRGSAEDVQFLVRWAHSLSFVDWSRVGLVGHSAGAQAMLRYAAQPGCAGDALVLLDTTQDYYALGMPLHEAVVKEATEGVAQLTQPMLVAAGPEAIFALCDRLVNADRTYLTMPELGHDEFISQGFQRLDRIAREVAAGRAGADSPEVARTPAARASYRALCETVRSFLAAELGRGDADFLARVEHDRARPWSPETPCLARVPRGVSAPEPYDEESDAPPTPRQFRDLFEKKGVESACPVLERFRDFEPRSPLYSSTMVAGSLLYGLIESGRRAEAELYHATLKDLSIQVLDLFEFLSDIGTMQGKPEQALRFMRLAHELDPENAGVAAKLEKLEKPEKE